MDDKEAREIRKRLDEVVGARFDPDARGRLFDRIRRGALRWLVAAALAIGAASLVVYTIESHRLPSEETMKATKSTKPVEVRILPSQPAK